MKRALTLLSFGCLLAASLLVAQQVIPVTTFSITGLNAKVASSTVPDGIKTSLTSKLDNAQAAYVRAQISVATGILNAFVLEVAAQSGKLIPSDLAGEFSLGANRIVAALQNGLRLGGSEVGIGGAILQVNDANSPAFGARLTIPPNAFTAPVFISMTVPEKKPDNPVLTIPGSGIALGPEGLVLAVPATLVLPYPDANADGIVDGTSFPADFLKVGVQDALGRISFPPRDLDTVNHTQTVQIGHFSFYWNVTWRWWPPGTLTYKFLWPAGGVRIVPGYDLNALKEGVRQAVLDWAPAMAQAGFSFQEVPAGQPASFQFGFFDPWAAFVLSGNIYRQDVSGVGFLSGGFFFNELPRQAVWTYGNASPVTAGASFDVRFNTDFGFFYGGPNLAWTIDSNGSPSAVSIHAVAVHAIGHVLGLNDPFVEMWQPPVMASLADLMNPEICLFSDDVYSLRQLYGVSSSLPLPACPHAGIAVTPGSFDFGAVFTGSTAQRSFTIRNNATGTLLLRQVSISPGDFTLDTSATAMALRAGGDTTFKVNFAPSGVGPRQATVNIVSNAPTSPTLIAASGTGVIPLPDLAITKADGPDPVASGGTLTYTITVANIGNGGAPGAVVTDTLPTTVTFQSCSVPCSRSGNVVTVNLGSLAPSATTSFNIVVSAPVVTSQTTITNVATVSTAGDPNPANNQASQTTTVSPAAPPSQQGGGPPGGRITAIAIDPSAPATLYAGTYGGGVFKSTNGGASWVAASSGLTKFVLALAIDPTVPATLYAGTYYGAGVYKSTNGGASWATAGSGLTNSNVCTLVIDPTNPATLYAGTSGGGVYKSTNGGTTWVTASSGLTNTQVAALAIDPVDPATLYTATYGGGVFKSTNGGATWVGLTNLWFAVLAIDPVNPATLYAGTYYGGGVLKSTNGGATWVATGSELTNPVRALAIHPANPATLYAGTQWGGVFKSTDGAANWVAASSGVPNTLGYVLAIDPTSPTTLYAGTDGGGLFKSTNAGASWVAVSSGMTNATVLALAIHLTNPATLYAGTWGGVFKTTNGGATWVPASSGLTNATVPVLASDPTDPVTLYAGTSGGGVFKSTNGGASWAPASSGLTTLGVQALVIDQMNPATLYAGLWSSGVFKSANAGASWVAASSGLTNTDVRSLAIDAANPGTLYAGTYGTGVFKTTNGGASWVAANAGISSKVVGALAIDPINPATLYAGTRGGGVFKSINGGASWVLAGLPGETVLALAIDQANPAILYAAGSGVFKSVNGGASWFPANAGLSNGSVAALAIDPTNPATLYAGTYGAGVFKSTNGAASWEPTGAQ